MKGKYSVTRILPAYCSKPENLKKDIHIQLEETITERKKILKQWEGLFQSQLLDIKKDIHAQLEETIAEYKKTMKQWEWFFPLQQDRSFAMKDKQAA